MIKVAEAVQYCVKVHKVDDDWNKYRTSFRLDKKTIFTLKLAVWNMFHMQESTLASTCYCVWSWTHSKKLITNYHHLFEFFNLFKLRNVWIGSAHNYPKPTNTYWPYWFYMDTCKLGFTSVGVPKATCNQRRKISMGVVFNVRKKSEHTFEQQLKLQRRLASVLQKE